MSSMRGRRPATRHQSFQTRWGDTKWVDLPRQSRSTFQEDPVMPTKIFTSGRIRKADYNPASRQLDLHWDNKSVLAYKHVPEEVYRRLCSAPNPATYWEDRIAEEYPKGTPMTSNADPAGARKLSDLFGDND
jgi:hypothetical protein